MPDDRGTGRRDAGPGHHPGPAPAAARSRPGRGKRSDDSADWPSTEWDKLSDVDYWAELASDKPLTTTAQLAAPARGGQDHVARAGAAHDAAADAPGLPLRRRPQLAAAPVPLPGPAPALPRSIAAAGYLPDDPTIDQGGEARRDQQRIQVVPDDDDPLTSPSFPRVPTDDSRSFRSSRTGAHLPGPEASAQGAPTEQFASYERPTAQFGAPAAADRGRPDSYPASTGSYPAGSGPHARPGTGAGPASGRAPSAVGAIASPPGNPYGSYVGTPPGGALPGRPAEDRSGRPGAPYPPAGDPNSYSIAPPYLPASSPGGYRGGSYPPAGEPNGRPGAPYPPGGDPNSYRGGSYAPGDGRSGPPSGWYPRHPDSPPAGAEDAGTLPGAGRHDVRGAARRSGDGRYYPPDYLPDYPPGRPVQEGYLPAVGYPDAPAAPYAQDPYGPDGYGGGPGYEALGR